MKTGSTRPIDETRSRIEIMKENAYRALSGLLAGQKEDIAELSGNLEEIGERAELEAEKLESMNRHDDPVAYEKQERIVKDKQLKVAMLRERIAQHQLNLLDAGSPET